MIKTNIYLNFDGTTEEAFNFYKTVFGTEIGEIHRFSETPDADKLPIEEQNRIMHISLPVGENMTLMATDTSAHMGQKLEVGNNFYISLNTDSKTEADNLFTKLAAGGKIEMPIADMFWGSYFGMLKDKFGINWMVSFDKPKN